MPTTLTSFKTFLLWSLFVGRINRRTRKSMQTAEKCKLQSFLQRRTHPALPKFFQPLISGGRGWDQHKSFRLSGICISDLNIFHQKISQALSCNLELGKGKIWTCCGPSISIVAIFFLECWPGPKRSSSTNDSSSFYLFQKDKERGKAKLLSGIANRRFWYCCS